MSQSPENLSFIQHLDELRARIIKSSVAIIVATFVFYLFIDQVLAFIIKPVGHLVFTSPADAFLARMTITILGGMFIALPYVFFHIWQFIAAGLKTKERRYIRIYFPFSVGLFFLGVLFAYYVTVPLSIKFLLGFATDAMVPMITIKNYISFVGTLVLAFGIIFELPLILMFLTKIGIVTPAFLEQKRKMAIVFILFTSAFITPPDLITMVVMAGPLVLLYEIGVIVTKYNFKETTNTVYGNK